MASRRRKTKREKELEAIIRQRDEALQDAADERVEAYKKLAKLAAFAERVRGDAHLIVEMARAMPGFDNPPPMTGVVVVNR